MANLATLKAALNAAIYQNNQNAITGEALNTILNNIIDTLGTGYRYAGVATPSANPGTVDNRIFYLATAAGTYTNFGGAVLDGKALHVFIYDTTWHNIMLDVPTNDALAVLIGSALNSVQGKDNGCEANGDGSFALGYTDGNSRIVADNPGAHAEGCAIGATIIASGVGAHAEGSTDYISSDITASGEGAHAEGSGTTASGDVSHAEGSGTTASSDAAHAEGDGTVASGGASHAEGFNTAASALAAHAEGNETTAQNVAEHAEGKYNASHKKTTGTANEQAAGSTLSSVGCGTSANDRKNAIEVMQNGDVYIKGVGGYDGTNPTPARKVARILENCIQISESFAEMFNAVGNVYYADFGNMDWGSLFSVVFPHETPNGYKVTYQPFINQTYIQAINNYFSVDDAFEAALETLRDSGEFREDPTMWTGLNDYYFTDSIFLFEDNTFGGAEVLILRQFRDSYGTNWLVLQEFEA